MRFLLACVVIVSFAAEAQAECICRCVDGQAAAVCSSPADIRPLCAGSVCSGASEGSKAGITTGTIPPSTTGPENSGTAATPSTTVPVLIDPQAGNGRSTTREYPPRPTQPGRAVCYQRQVFNPQTQSYQWQEVCD